MELKLITSNSHKFEEMSAKLSGIVELSLNSQAYSEIQAASAVDIARQSLASLIPVVEGNFCIEDSGLIVNHLNGFPGPYSSYVFKTIGYNGIIDLLKGAEDRTAKFISVIGLYFDGKVKLFTGECLGKISEVGKGDMGFGFDPIFIPDGYDLTFAELDMEEKNKISHRSMSTAMLKQFLENNS